MSVEDKNSAVETVSREKATNDPGSVGAPMSGVVVEVRVKEGQEIKKGDPLCSKSRFVACSMSAFSQSGISRNSSQRYEGKFNELLEVGTRTDPNRRWNLPCLPPFQDTSNVLWCMKVRARNRTNSNEVLMLMRDYFS